MRYYDIDQGSGWYALADLPLIIKEPPFTHTMFKFTERDMIIAPYTHSPLTDVQYYDFSTNQFAVKTLQARERIRVSNDQCSLA